MTEHSRVAIIDPPVGPASPPDEIEAWLRELERLREEMPDCPVVSAEIRAACRWLSLSKQRQ